MPTVINRLIAFLLLAPASLVAQKAYFQQTVHYRIQASLNDVDHTLTAQLNLEYTNNSPDTLRAIWMHLWPNAYSRRRTAFAEQKLRLGDAKFYFAEAEKLGGISKLDFSVDGQPTTWKYHPDHRDIALVNLPQPLPPGGKIELATPFDVDIPASFSRLGHVGTSYQMTQWYPKPAVYDNRGWHPMPYLDQGEFYSEFGRYEVALTLPENYVVGATGVLQDAAEKAFLSRMEAQTREQLAKNEGKLGNDTFPPSATAVKTIRFIAEDVHDFAWFADKRFLYLRDTAVLPDGKKVECSAMFLPSDAKHWSKGAFYVRRAVEFYSTHVGPYVWPQATAVHSALSAGGGMEYPMITVIGNSGSARSLDQVITHEVGHNWFYGILASDERTHPWMDEGINSYYEQRYMQRYYGSDAIFENIPRSILDTLHQGSFQEIALKILAREHVDTPPDSHSDAFTNIGYGIQVYLKPAFTLRWLEKSTGTLAFDQAMQTYYRDWKLKHPYPEDLRASWEKSGLKADWFFEAMTSQNHADFVLSRVNRVADGYQLRIRNRGALGAPFPVTAVRNGKPLATRWFPPLEGTTEVLFAADSADQFVVDYFRTTGDLHPKNNARRTGGLFPGLEPVRFRLLAPIENSRRSVIAVLPWLGWNNYDKFMLGAVFYNSPMPSRRFQYFIAPGYGFGSKNLTGVADLRLHLYPGGLFSKVTIGGSAKTFTYDEIARYNVDIRYYRLVPEIRAELSDNSTSFLHAINFRTLFTGAEGLRFRQPDTGLPILEGVAYNAPRAIYEFRYEGFQRAKPNSFRYVAALEHQSYPFLLETGRYWRGTLEWVQDFHYSNSRKVTVRLFGGYFFENSRRQSTSGDPVLSPGTLALSHQGYNDYRFDEVYFGRSEQEGIWSRQVSPLTDGGFKNAFGRPYSSVLGNSNNYLFALNIHGDLPGKLPLGLPVKPYADFAIYDPARPATMAGEAAEESEWVWSAGLMLSFFSGGLEVYFPLLNSSNLNDQYKVLGGGYWRRVTFSVNLRRVTPESVNEYFLR